MSNAPDATAEQEAAAAAKSGTPAEDARRWLHEERSATLCTTSARADLEGYPFGSVVPYALSASGAPVIFIAHIAAHTANLRRDPRGSLFVRQPDTSDDPQTGWRITVMGRWSRLMRHDDDTDPHGAPVERVSADEIEDIHARYAERVPSADRYDETHGFAYWRMSAIEKIRYIAGFGKICWLDGDTLHRDPVVDGAAAAIAHMNDDHADNMIEMCRGLYGFVPTSVRMVALERTGFLLRSERPDRLLWFPFGREIDGAAARGAIIEVLQRARARTSP